MKQIIILFILGLFVSIPNINAQSRGVKKMRESFIEGVFFNYYDKTIPIIKWENRDTLRYCFNGQLEFITKQNWNSFINQIEHLIDITIIETNNPLKADIHIYFGDILDFLKEYELENIFKIQIHQSWQSRSYRKYNKNHQLQTSYYCIVTKAINKREIGIYLIKKLFLKSLGFLGDGRLNSSFFYQYRKTPELNIFKEDKRIIKLFYSDSLKAGMSLKEVEDALNKIDLEAIYNAKL